MPRKIPTHQPIPTQRRYEQRPERQADARFYASMRWREVRAAKLRANPLCECGCEWPAQEVHHKLDRKLRPDLAFALDNLQSLTKACHSRITRERTFQKEQSGGVLDSLPTEEGGA